MKRFFKPRDSVRLRMASILLLALLPFVLLFVNLSSQVQHTLRRHSDEQLLGDLRQVSTQLRTIVSNTQQLLMVLSRLPSIRNLDGTTSSRNLAEIHGENPIYANIFANRNNGNVFASAVPLKRRVNSLEKPWFQKTLRSDSLIIADYQQGKITGIGVLIFSYPLLDKDGQLIGLVGASLPNRWFQYALEGLSLPDDTQLAVFEDSGKIISGADNLDNDALMNTLKQIGGRSQGTFQMRDADSGRIRRYAFSKLLDTDFGHGIYITALRKDTHLAETIHQVMYEHTLMIVLSFFGFLLLSAWGYERVIHRHLAPILATVKRLTSGDYAARTGIGDQQAGEFSGLARVIDEMAANTQQKEQEMETFTRAISHDLRGPLRGMNGFSRLLEDKFGKELDAEGRDYLQRIQRASVRMGELIDNLLGLSSLYNHTVRRQSVDLSAMARTIAEQMRNEQPQRCVQFDIQQGMQADCDPKMMQLLLEHLFSNAWKFTACRETGLIRFGCTRRNAGGGCEYYVADNGIGFDMAYKDKLYLPFQRLHESGGNESSGIGLAMAKRIIEHHHGHIEAEGTPGQGAVFRFTLSAQQG